MQLSTKFELNQRVRVKLNDLNNDFIAVVTAIHVDVTEENPCVWYEVLLPESKRGTGRNYTKTWGYKEQYLWPPEMSRQSIENLEFQEAVAKECKVTP